MLGIFVGSRDGNLLGNFVGDRGIFVGCVDGK